MYKRINVNTKMRKKSHIFLFVSCYPTTFNHADDVSRLTFLCQPTNLNLVATNHSSVTVSGPFPSPSTTAPRTPPLQIPPEQLSPKTIAPPPPRQLPPGQLPPKEKWPQDNSPQDNMQVCFAGSSDAGPHHYRSTPILIMSNDVNMMVTFVKSAPNPSVSVQ